MERRPVNRPNVLVLHAHDLGRFLHCYGIPTVTTPHLDRLAADGVRFDNAFAVAPQCSPARAALFTGRYPQQNGVLGLTHSYFGWDLHAEEKHLAQLLGAQGYRTGLLGVHHESRVRDDAAVAARLGFDDIQTGGRAGMVAERAVERLHAYAREEQPFYLQVGFIEPHRIPSDRDPHGVMGFLGEHIEPDTEHGVTVPPYLVDDEPARAEIAEVQGSVRLVDDAVGRVLAALADAGLAENTLVVFTTDHGLALPRAKCSVYDPGLETALLMRAPFRSDWGGRTIGDAVTHVDVLPTILELLDLPAPTNLAGSSLVPLVEHPSGPPRQRTFAQLTYHTYYDPRRCVRDGRYKLIANFSTAPQFMDPSQSWNRRCTPGGIGGSVVRNPPLELYDLESDPLELTNLADDADHATIRVELLDALDAWMRAIDDPLLHGPVPEPQCEVTMGLVNGGSRAALG